ncbi:MAG: CapA family protein [Butyrivibrio sp.]|nr:CapA family protein [Butyrivibrio sp.]
MDKTGQRKCANKRGLLRLIVVAAFCCAFVAAAFVAVFGGQTGTGRDSSFAQKVRLLVAPPTWVHYAKKSEQSGELVLKVEGGKAALYAAGSVDASDVLNVDNDADYQMPGENSPFWSSPSEYKTQDGFLTDIDRDGATEMILLVWKRGRFGKHRPFWITSDERCYSQHIFIYDVGSGAQKGIDGNESGHDSVISGVVSQKWFASDIGVDVKRMKLLNEGSATSEAVLLTEDIDGNCALWHWESFGLKTMDNEVAFLAFGDNLIHKSIYEYAYAHESGSFDYLYEPFKEEIMAADVAAFNAETVLVDKESAVSGYPQFGSPLAVGKALAAAGFDVASCANNHALDKGIYGIEVTSSFYKDNGITCVGIQGSSETQYRPYEVITRNGIRIALLSYTYGTNGIDASDKYPYAVHYLPGNASEQGADSIEEGSDTAIDQDFFSEDRLVMDIQDARNDADFVVVFAHWGDEYETDVSDYQKHMADVMAKAGADVIIGSHPHVVQETEVIDRGDGGQTLVYYSLGNFVADQGKVKRSSDGQAVETGGAKALFTIEHCYDGVRIKSWDIREIHPD